ncbi:WcbI family polysaccharide biosynthesis putative acetyltransferase [Methylobacterium sp. J-026]|uniref:WcbI family polysaccharide biosynthesis putative acetyltransferase n=1 Tax=Methylobacterium sp. J-026 TaxID=2836624 RepID=UPI001FBB3D0F|nr:WcbI family polysaccharide biosynthesis putative acetyltransferase [Methylobacterium sp. J-026]MCJ2136919.1 WcbI family polysaccharide biosynthesis putative acetyltransferase [Methylobacterium sp. J-026]
MMNLPDVSVIQRLRSLFSVRQSQGSPRLLVIGGEQSAAVAHAMACIAPEATVTYKTADDATKLYAAERLLAEFGRHDFVFLSADLPLCRNGGAIAGLHGPKVARVPVITFAAFHPDQVRVGSYSRVLVTGPMGQSHSALVLFGYLSRLSQGEVLKLFQRRVFERVGYFDAWDKAAEQLRKLGAEAGYDLEASIARWMRRGCFMHSTNQIKLHVIVDLARELLDRGGVCHQQCNLEDYLSGDPGRGESWPVYPEIAAHYGVAGSALFLRPASGRRSSRSTMPLNRFVEESFAAYARLPRTSLVNRRVAQWQTDVGLRADLRRIVEEV